MAEFVTCAEQRIRGDIMIINHLKLSAIERGQSEALAKEEGDGKLIHYDTVMLKRKSKMSTVFDFHFF